MRRKIVALSVVSILLAGYVWSQGQPQDPRPPTPPTPPPVDKQPQPNIDRRQNEQRRLEPLLFLTGKVVIEDGSPLPEPVAVEMVCNGQIRMRVYSHTQGDFSLQLGGGSRNVGVFDASTAEMGTEGITRSRSTDSPWFGGSGGGSYNSFSDRIDLTGCDLRASLPGFQSTSVTLGFRRTLDRPDVGMIILRRLGNVQGTTISFNTLAAPEKARKAYERARKELVKKEPDRLKAAKELENSIKEYQDFAAAWNLLGKTRLALQDKDGARQAFAKAMSADPKYIDPYLSLAILEAEQSRWAETIKLTSQIHELNPYVTHSQYLSAVANYQLDQLEQAEKTVQEIQKSSDAQRYPMTHYLLGAILARRGDFTSAASEFRRFLQTKADPTAIANVNKLLAEWEGQGLIKKDSSSKEK